jgi:hypothetical protein
MTSTFYKADWKDKRKVIIAQIQSNLNLIIDAVLICYCHFSGSF